jgi:hypothetical protein
VLKNVSETFVLGEKTQEYKMFVFTLPFHKNAIMEFVTSVADASAKSSPET